MLDNNFLSVDAASNQCYPINYADRLHKAHRGAVEQLDKCHPRWAAQHGVTVSDASVCQFFLLKLKAACDFEREFQN